MTGCKEHADPACLCDVVIPSTPCPPGRTPVKALAQAYETWTLTFGEEPVAPAVRTLFEASVGKRRRGA